MRFYTTKPLQFLFPQVLWRGPSDHVYLTFDDGPHPVATPFVLQELSQHGIKATFFLLGSCVEQHPDLARRIVAEGHTIGNHTYDHVSLLFRDGQFTGDQITRTRDVIRKHTGITTKYFRPPFGHGSPTTYRVSKEHGHEVVMWDVDPGDWQPVSPDVIISRSIGAVDPGSIVLFHDNDNTQNKIAGILRPLISNIRSRNLHFAPLPA